MSKTIKVVKSLKTIKKTRRRYTFEKNKLLKMFDESDESILSFSKKVNIPHNTLQDWIQQKEKIYSISKEKIKKKSSHKGKETSLKENIELEILDWFKSIRSMGLPITNNLIIGRAKYLIKKLDIDTECTFTSGWLRNFKQRYNIVKRKESPRFPLPFLTSPPFIPPLRDRNPPPLLNSCPSGQGKNIRKNDCELETIINFIEILNKKINSRKYDSIINIDEIGPPKKY